MGYVPELNDDDELLTYVGNGNGNSTTKYLNTKPSIALRFLTQSWEVHSLDTNIRSLFKGWMRQTITCLHCKEDSVSFNEFLDILVPIG